MITLFAWVLACTNAPKDPKAAGPTGETGSPETDTGVADCSFTPTLGLRGELVPGQTLTLSVTADRPVEVVFSVSLGSVEGDQWSIPADVAPFLDEEAVVGATVTAAGCPDQVVEQRVVVGHPMSDRVVVLYNPNVEGSLSVAEAYAEARGLGDDQLCGLPASDPTTVLADEGQSLIRGAVDCAAAVGPQVTVLVPVYGFPYKVSGAIADFASGALTVTSLDALLFFGSTGASMSEARYNPIYQEGDSMAGVYDPYVPALELRDNGRRFFLVSRIDGADAAAAIALLDRTLLAEETRDGEGLDGIVYVDGNRGDVPPATDEFGSYESGEWNMWGTRAVFEDLGRWPVVWDGNAEEFGTAPAPTDCPNALYYAGWYSYYHYNDCFTWSVGAIGGHLDSCSACDIRAPGTWAGSALIDGITATFGAVNEPYVAGMPEYDQFFLYLSQGASFGEAAYEATVVGGWMMVFVGDPLYTPFAAD